MNKRGFIDFEEISPGMIILPVLGFFMAIFTAGGGFSKMVTGESFPVPLFYRLMAGLLGAVIGFVIYMYMDSKG